MARLVRKNEKTEDEDKCEKIRRNVGHGEPVSATDCNINSACFIAGPSIPLQRVLDRTDGSDLPGMPLEHAAHNVYDRNERKFATEEPFHRDLVRGVEDGRHRSTGPAGVVGEVDRRETAGIDRLKIE